MSPMPKVQGNEYNEKRLGYYGELGQGLFGARYLLTGFPINDIDSLKLVSEVKESDTWTVKALFQRDINEERVAAEIMPYFLEEDKIKFFNPLTIVLLPIDEKGQILREVKEQVGDAEWEGMPAIVSEASGYYRITCPKGQPQTSQLEWNARRVMPVAVDGQHRLSAIKRLRDQYTPGTPAAKKFESVGFPGWTVPVVLIVFPPPALGKKTKHSNIENMRDIFITINKEAQEPTRCRQILLNDFSVTAMCCQELLDYCQQPLSASSVPLLFFDWRARGEGDAPEHPHAFMRVEELEDLHINFLLGEDGEGAGDTVYTTDQKNALSLGEEGSVDPSGLGKKDQRELVRDQYKKVVLPAVLAIFSEFKPLGQYIAFLTKMRQTTKTDIDKHALSVLEYGTHHSQDKLLREPINLRVEQFEDDCQNEKSKLPSLVSNAIGVRAVFYALKTSRNHYSQVKKKTISWSDAAKWMLKYLNEAFDEKYFDKSCPHLRHLALGPDDKIINYRPDQQRQGLGVLLTLVVCAKAHKKKDGDFDEIISELLEDVEEALVRGYTKEVGIVIRDKYPEMDRRTVEFKALVSKAAGKKVDKHMEGLKKSLGVAAV